MTTNKPLIITALLAIWILCSGNDCGPSVLVKNPGFDVWCDQELCYWTVEQGEIRKTSTWHRRDYGAAMVGAPVVISQLVEIEGTNVPQCFAFNLMGKTTDNAQVYLEMDFFDDGVVEYSHPIPFNNWTPVEYMITPPQWYDSVRFYIRKIGQGQAVLAQIKVTEGDECSEPPLAASNAPNGIPCNYDAECTSGLCVELISWNLFQEYEKTCGLCDEDSDCQTGYLCGESKGDTIAPFRECVEEGKKDLGENCGQNEECRSDVCCGSKCSECCANNDILCSDCEEVGCTDSEACLTHFDDQDLYMVCSEPYSLELGALCLDNESCESGVCCNLICSECCTNDDCQIGECGSTDGSQHCME